MCDWWNAELVVWLFDPGQQTLQKSSLSPSSMTEVFLFQTEPYHVAMVLMLH
jgi:hypothetical protein